jgi:hypothetical protein
MLLVRATRSTYYFFATMQESLLTRGQLAISCQQYSCSVEEDDISIHLLWRRNSTLSAALNFSNVDIFSAVIRVTQLQRKSFVFIGPKLKRLPGDFLTKVCRSGEEDCIAISFVFVEQFLAVNRAKFFDCESPRSASFQPSASHSFSSARTEPITLESRTCQCECGIRPFSRLISK